VLVGNGSDEVLALCTRAFCEPEGTVGYLDPSYSLYPSLADIADVRKRPFALDAAFKWQVPARLDVGLFLLTRPNAPTSLSLPLDDVRLVAERCPGVVLVDEAYADFADDTVDHLLQAYPNMLLSRTLSKSYSLAGLRLGYAIGPLDLIQALHKIKDSYNTDALSQQLALAAIGDQAWMRSNVAAICTTDDPVDDLAHHRRIREDGFATKVLPAWRPDKAMAAENPAAFSAYMDALAAADEARFVDVDAAERVEVAVARAVRVVGAEVVVADHPVDDHHRHLAELLHARRRQNLRREGFLRCPFAELAGGFHKPALDRRRHALGYPRCANS
jgi:histidinol-phosphate/aromatic aminotransferase/cobyric acid decarboxylase-like protein